MKQMQSLFVNVIVEDFLQEVVLRKLFENYRKDIGVEYQTLRGKDRILKNLNQYCRAAKHFPFLVCIDLDRTPCAPQLLSEYLQEACTTNFLFRIMVREVEAWILADRERFAGFMGVSVSKIPQNTETIDDPKEFLINLARKSRKAKSKSLKDLIPIGVGKVGQGYNHILGNFVVQHWNPESARRHNKSLDKAIKRLEMFLRE